MTYPAPTSDHDWRQVAHDLSAKLTTEREENTRLRVEVKRAGSAGTLGKRIAALSEENAALRAQVETLTGLADHAERLVSGAPIGRSIAGRTFLKRFRALKGKQ